MSRFDLTPLQREGVAWLRDRGRAYLADCAGFGKSRQLLAAIGDSRLLVVCPAAIRDAQVWQDEAELVGWGGRMRVISYHQLGRQDPVNLSADIDVVIFDEAQHLKDKDVGWHGNAFILSQRVSRVLMASGTPTPNGRAAEYWGQLRMIRRDLRAFWPWVQSWFIVQPGEYTKYEIQPTLQACRDEDCHNYPEIADEDCEHWKRFRAEELDPWLMGRPEELLDLPPVVGEDKPLWTPMTGVQRKVYSDLKRDYLARVPGTEVLLEAVSDGKQFHMLRKATTGLRVVDQTSDPQMAQSAKLKLLAERLEERTSPTLVVCYYKATGGQIARIAGELGRSWAPFGGGTSERERRRAVKDFQAGQIDVLVASVAAIKEGITLTRGSGVMLVERSWVPSDNHQVVRRVARRGQSQTVSVDQFVTPNSIDDGQWQVLHSKRRSIDKLDVARLLDGKVG